MMIKSRRMRWVGNVTRMGRRKTRENLEDLGVDGSSASKMDLGKIGFEEVDWTHLAQDRDRWQALVYTVRNVRVP
jgi:hypothetical protein